MKVLVFSIKIETEVIFETPNFHTFENQDAKLANKKTSYRRRRDSVGLRLGRVLLR
ncbi:hypothetical protein [Novipirellula rosea]|uniref:hypothetical protein n=1 Tax=Novipirellula rosea TaxID=1031540 RepID=UPI0031EC27E2